MKMKLMSCNISAMSNKHYVVYIYPNKHFLQSMLLSIPLIFNLTFVFVLNSLFKFRLNVRSTGQTVTKQGRLALYLLK